MAINKNENNNKNEKRKPEAGLNQEAKKTIALNKEKKSLPKKEPGKAVAKKDKVGRLTQIRRFIREVLNELKKVHWLGTREVIIYTIIVLVAVLFVGSLIWLFDSLLGLLLGRIM